MRANIGGLPFSATTMSVCIAACHSGASSGRDYAEIAHAQSELGVLLGRPGNNFR
jgi:hypothetical protein